VSVAARPWLDVPAEDDPDGILMSMHNSWQQLRSYPRGVKLTLAVYTVAFTIGTTTHLIVLIKGWWFAGHPFINAYWTSLTFFDPLAVFLLFRFPKAGLLLASTIMVTDVGINSLATFLYFDNDGHYAVEYAVQLQTAFLGFVLGSAPLLWPQFNYKTVA
jgi:hypothetical protein